jgi:hypothetical protein
MPIATITVTDKTQTPQSIQALVGQSMQPQANPSGNTLTAIAGYSVVVTGAGHGFAQLGGVAYLSLQFDPGNSGMKGYVGDEGVKNNGTLQAKTMLPGDVDVHQGHSYVVHLGEIFITADTNNAIWNIEWHYT